MDADIEAYFGRLEACFGGRRGAPLLLSPLDFEKALEWYAAGVPADVAEEGVSRYFARLEARRTPRRHAVCLSFAERDILAVLRERRAAAVGRAAGVEEGDPSQAVRSFLETRAEALDAFLAGEEVRALPVLRNAALQARRTVADLLPRSGEQAAALEAELAPLDRELARIALLESPPERCEAWRRAASERLRSSAQGADARGLREAVDLLAAQEALRALKLPRLSLLFMED